MTSESQSAYTLEELAKDCRVSVGTLYNEIKRGRLGVTKIGTRTIVTAEQKVRWLKCLPTI